MKPARVFVLYTGGTIGMAPADAANPDSPLIPQPLEVLLRYVPALVGDTRFHLEYSSFDPPLDSSDVGPRHWVEMAERIAEVYERFDGFVILHGTDTMAYTASGLAFLFENLAKPVVVTGSQLPISGMRTDAIMNLVNAIHVAGYTASGLPCVPEVAIVFADKIIRGCRARKVSASSWAGFDSPNFPPLGHIGEQIRISRSLLRPMPAPGERFRIHTALDTRVLDIGLTPGFQPSYLRHILTGLDEIQAIVLRTYGTGNAPGDAGFLEAIAEMHRQGKTVVNVTQCQEGSVEMGLYASSSGLLASGVVSALDMTPEAALTKLMWTLGGGGVRGGEAAAQMQVNQRGEQSQNLFDLRFGPSGGAQPEARFARTVELDPRLDPAQVNRAVLRFSGLGLEGVKKGARVRLRVRMNGTPVAEIPVTWYGAPLEAAEVLDDAAAAGAAMRKGGEIALELDSPHPALRFRFDELFLAVFTNASEALGEN